MTVAVRSKRLIRGEKLHTQTEERKIGAILWGRGRDLLVLFAAPPEAARINVIVACVYVLYDIPVNVISGH